MKGTKLEYFDHIGQIKGKPPIQLLQNCRVLYQKEVLVITVKHGEIFRALAIRRCDREVLDQSGPHMNALAALESLHDKTAAGLADMFPDGFRDSRDTISPSPTTVWAGNDDTPLPSPEGESEYEWAVVPKEEELRCCTEGPVATVELGVLHTGNLVSDIDTLARGLRGGAVADATAVQSADPIGCQTPNPETEPMSDEGPIGVTPAIPESMEPEPTSTRPESAPPSNKQRIKGKKKKGRGKVVHKIVQAIEDRGVDIAEPTHLSPELSVVEPVIPAEVPPALEQPPTPPETPPLQPPTPPLVPYEIDQSPVDISDHYLTSHAWHAPLEPPFTAPSDSEANPPSPTSATMEILDTLILSIEALETPEVKARAMLQVWDGMRRVLKGLADWGH